MACCKCCCGGVDCTEGQQGKCCCGGVYGTCCQTGEYCCSGVCEPEPCDQDCGGPCEWQPVWVGGFWSNGWELLSGCNEGCSCDEPAVEDVGTEAYPFQATPYETACSPNMGAMQAEAGPGAELKALLRKIGITATPGCACNQRAKVMDERGCDWCEANIAQIDQWLAEEAKKRKLPYLSLAGRALIRMAIRRARKKGT